MKNLEDIDTFVRVKYGEIQASAAYIYNLPDSVISQVFWHFNWTEYDEIANNHVTKILAMNALCQVEDETRIRTIIYQELVRYEQSRG